MATAVNNVLKGFLYDVSKTLDDLNFYDKVVQFDDDANGVASSEATFVFSGPPVAKSSYAIDTTLNPDATLASSGILSMLTPIGAVQQISVNEGKQIIPFRELGSKLLRQAAGPTQYSGSMSRVLSMHSNLKFSLYEWLFKLYPNGISLTRAPSDNNTHFIGLESEIFAIPFGLLILVGSAGGKVIQAEYLEKCHIVNAGSSKQVGNTLIVDNVSFTVSRSVPLLTSANLISSTTGVSTFTDNNGLRRLPSNAKPFNVDLNTDGKTVDRPLGVTSATT